MITDEMTLLDSLEDDGRALFAEYGACIVKVNAGGADSALVDPALSAALYAAHGICRIRVTEERTQVLNRNDNVVHEV